MKITKANSSYNCFMASPYFSSKHLTYFSVYDKYLSKFINNEIVFVEIGIFSGGSLFMWRDFFGKKARIIGIDMNPEAKKWEAEGFEIFIGDQSDPMFWIDFFEKIGDVDVIIDDGGHTYEQQIITATSCMARIKDGGVLLVEDVHTSFFSEFGYPSKYTFSEWAKSKVVDINARFTETDLPLTNFSRQLDSIHFHESIIVFSISDKCSNNSPINNRGARDGARDFRHENSSMGLILKNFRKLQIRYPSIFKNKKLIKLAKKSMNIYTKHTARLKVLKLKKYF